MGEAGYLDVNGGRLYYEVEGSGHPFVLIHAGVANLRMWDEQVPAFAERYRVIRYDTRGYGRSETDQVEFTNRGDLAAVLDHFDAPSAHILGLSRGGGFALDFAIENPDRVTALIEAAGGIGGYEPEASHEDTATFEEAERRWEAKDWGWLTDFETKWWVDGPGQPPDRVDPAVRELVAGWIGSTYRAEKNEGLPQAMDPPASERLGELKAPTLVLVGDLDDKGTQASMHRLAAEVPGARLEVFEGVAHMINLEQPDRFTRVVLDFLASVT